MGAVASRPCERACGRQAQEVCSFPALQRLAFARRPSRPLSQSGKGENGRQKTGLFLRPQKRNKKTQEPLALAFFIALFCGEKCAVDERTLRVPGSSLSPRSFLVEGASLPQISIIGRFASCAPCRKGTPPRHSRWRSRRNRGNSIFSLYRNRIPRR